MALSANPPLDSAPVDQTQVGNDVDALFKAGQGKSGTDEVGFGLAPARIGVHELIVLQLK